MTGRRASARASALVLALALVGLATPAARGAASGPAPFVVGTGSASGTVASARIYYGGLSIPVPVGQSAASFEGKRSRSLGAVVSASAASGLTGASVPGTSPSVVDSNDSVHRLHSALADPVGGTVDLDAAATPAASSDVHLTDLDLPGVARVEGGRARSTVAVVAGKERTADAAVSIATVSLGAGLVELSGLRWTATHRSRPGEPDDVTEQFALGAVRLGGMPVPLPADGSSLQPVIDLVNSVLGPLGISVSLPVLAHLDDGSADAGALRIGYGHGPVGTQVVGPLLAAVRPFLLPALQAVVSANSSLGVATLLLDLGLGVADGSGGAELSLGGVNAGTDDTSYTPAVPVSPVAGSGPAAAVRGAAPAAPPVLPAVPVVSPGTRPVLADGGPAHCALAASPRRHGECRSANGGAAIAVGLAVALGLAGYEVVIRRRRVRVDGAGAVS